MTRKLRFHSHACLSVEGERAVLLTDPWLFGEVFHGSLALRPVPDLETLDLGNGGHIWVSHAHPDHLHVPSLRLIRDRCTGPLTIYYQRTSDRAVRNALVEQGFKVVELTPRRETPVADDVSLTVFPTRGDSAVVIRLGDRIIVNQNDCSLARGEVEALRRMFPRIDAWFFQFSLGGYYANANDHAGLESARRLHLGLVAHCYAALRPRIFVPFASFFSYCKQGDAFLNDWTLTPAQLVAAQPDLPTQVLRPGDELLWQDWEQRNASNVAWWENTLREPVIIKPHAAVPDSAVLAAARALVENMRARVLGRFGPGETQLEIRETGRALALDFRRGRVELLEQGDPQKLVISAPAEELLFFLKSPRGGDIAFGSCFDVLDLFRWRRLRRFRSCRSVAEAARRRIWKLDRQLLGARLRSLRQRLRLDRLLPD
ncbi:MAG: MBL fold metallo-hydrolase [Gammaproteobacteria bacterium]|nr:MBL fold metallo-hydrolase [Gammaproteobacteria bacterium]